jgi:hypothetical protein
MTEPNDEQTERTSENKTEYRQFSARTATSAVTLEDILKAASSVPVTLNETDQAVQPDMIRKASVPTDKKHDERSLI